MKKILSLILVLIFILCMFAGCKPKIEDTEEYKTIAMLIENYEREAFGKYSYAITDAQYIKDFHLQGYNMIIETSDGKYHTTSDEDLMRSTASHDMYIVVTLTKTQTGVKTFVTYVYLSERGWKKLDEEIEKLK